MARPALVQGRLHASADSLGVGSYLNEGMRKLDKSMQRKSIFLGFLPDKLQENVGKVIKYLHCICQDQRWCMPHLFSQSWKTGDFFIFNIRGNEVISPGTCTWQKQYLNGSLTKCTFLELTQWTLNNRQFSIIFQCFCGFLLGMGQDVNHRFACLCSFSQALYESTQVLQQLL